MRELYKSIQESRVEIFTKYSKELSTISTKTSYTSISNVAKLLELIHILNSAPSFEKNFAECKK